MNSNFRRVAIVNRGEAAMRFIRAARDYNRETDAGLVTIALYTDPDRRALFVREADEAYRLGPANVTDRHGKRLSAYLDYSRLEAALQATKAEAAWVGWGFVAEHAAFAELCERLGVVFIGPSGAVIRQLGDKIAAKRLAEESEVPVAAWSGGPLEMFSQANEEAERLGYPLMLKSAAGGGGRGIRKVHSRDQLARVFQSARSEALHAFGDDRVFLERLVEGARHIEVQVIGDHHGNAWAVGIRDCSVQRRNQKVMEESGSTALNKEQHHDLGQAAVRLVRTAGYQNAGTVEFLYQTEKQQFAFMEVNTRLQVEHPVTEVTTGLDLVKLQLHVARGGRLEGEPPPAQGCAIEARLNAEDPHNGFMPAPGRVALFRAPLGPGVRVDAGVAEGDQIPPDFDSMIAKIIAHGRNREEALGRLGRALAETTVVIEGGTTNKALLMGLVEHPDVQAGDVTVAWLESQLDELTSPDTPVAEIAVLQAAVECYDQAFELELANFRASALRGRPEVSSAVGVPVELSWCNQPLKLTVFRLGSQRYRVAMDAWRVDLHVEAYGDHERRLEVAGKTYRTVVVDQESALLVEVDGRPHRLVRGDRGLIRAPAPAVVLSLNVEVGQEVKAGDRLVVLEAMKMEMPLTAPFDAVVGELRVRPNVQVEAGSPLVLLEPVEETSEVAASGRAIDFKPLLGSLPASGTPEKPEKIDDTLTQLKALLLGYDVDASATKGLVAELDGLMEQAERDTPGLFHREAELLAIFTDVHSLFRGRQGLVDEGADYLQRSSEEHLLTYLRTFNEERVPAPFLEKLMRALEHYGVERLASGDDLVEALAYLFKAHLHVNDQGEAVAHILARWLPLGEAGPPKGGTDLRAVLGRLAAVTRQPMPNVSDLAREVRHAFFDQPMLEKARRDVLASVERHLGAAISLRSGPNRDPHTAALVSVDQPCVPLLLPRFPDASDEARCYYLEVLTRRHYRHRDLEKLSFGTINGRPVAHVDYGLNGQSYHLVAIWSPFAEAGGALETVAGELADLPPERRVLLDLYLGDETGDCETIGQRLEQAIDKSGIGGPLQRIATIVGDASHVHGAGGVHHYTYMRDGDGWREDQIHRGFHPRMGERLQLWRLSNFEIERLASADEIYLFRGVARANPKDERLFAFAEVRDLTAVRDDAGRIRSLPRLEAVLNEGLRAIRHEQAKRAVRQRLHWNRVYLNIWPVVELQPHELDRIVRRLAPATADLGLEKVVARARVRVPSEAEPRDTVIEIANPDGSGASLSFIPPHDRPLQPLEEYQQNVIRARQRGLVYPYELVKMMTTGGAGRSSALPPGSFQEYDLDETGQALVPVDRPYGKNEANLIIGIIENRTKKYPEGMRRVIMLSDPTRAMGAIREPECHRINLALDLAESLGLPVEWFAVCAGATIAMDTGTENLDWTARVIRRLIEFTQSGLEINVIVGGINVGAQSYWNSEATMLMHCKGILIMTASGSMVLTGKRALDYSGSVSAPNNYGIGGYERIMGPNGEAQYWARDVAEACLILMRHYDHAYVMPGERFPRRAETGDGIERDVREYHHGFENGYGFERVGDIFSDETNPGRKKPFSIRRVMAAVVDQDHRALERWSAWQDAEIAVVWDAHLGGWPVGLIGIESKPLMRVGMVPTDGPDRWTAGTLFPLSSKKVARAINACSGNRPMVILANLSGFDGSPESMRRLQLEYGAEIGRAVVNFDGPIVFCVVSRYHGGAYVVFSNKLNEQVEVAALEGAYASVIGGAPAAAVVFARDVKKRTATDPRIKALREKLAQAGEAERGALRRQLDELNAQVHSEKLGQVAEEFDNIHTVQRALEVGSLDRLVLPASLRPYLIDAVSRGIERALAHPGTSFPRVDIGRPA